MVWAVAALLVVVLVILIQPGKAEMISGMGGLGGQAMNLFGVRQSRNVLQNLTIGLTVAIMVMSILVNKVFLDDGSTGERAPVTQGAELPTQPMPTGQPSPAPAPAPTSQPPSEQPQGN